MSDNLDLSILKTLITNKKQAIDFANTCDAKLFSSDVWNFANIITSYTKTFKDIPTLRVITERLSKGNNEKLVESITKTWAQLSSVTANEREFAHDLEKLKKRFAEKQIFTLKESLIKFEPGTMDISKALNEIQKTTKSIGDLSGNRSYERKTLKDALPGFTEKFNAKKNNPNLEAGIKTYYSFLDYSCNGLKPADFIIVAGESGFGKSLFLSNLSIQIWLQENSPTSNILKSDGKNVVFFSLEMPYEDIFNRIVARLSGIPIKKIENASLTKSEFHKMKQALDFINNYPFNFEIVDMSSDVCANDIDNVLEDIPYNIDVIAVDYLGIMKTNNDSNEEDWLKQGQVAKELRSIARKRQVPMLSAAQLNRKTKGKSSADNIGLDRLARSGTIATHATTVIQIENREKEELHSDIMLWIIKQRKGPKVSGRLLKNLSCATLLDIPTDYDNEDIFKSEDISEQIDDLYF